MSVSPYLKVTVPAGKSTAPDTVAVSATSLPTIAAAGTADSVSAISLGTI